MLQTELTAAGLSVRLAPGYSGRGNNWANGKPVGVMHHHTSLPVPYPVSRLYGIRNKCNINTKPDGTVWLVTETACNYSSGLGNRSVLNLTLADKAPTANATSRGNMFGNRYYLNFENDHPGDGSPLPAPQFDAIVIATRVVNAHYGLTPNKTISHAEWTSRKIDPYWNGDRRAIVAIRTALTNPTPPNPPTIEDTMFPLRLTDGWTSGPRPNKRDDVAFLQAMFGLDYGNQQGFYGPQTAADIAAKLGRSQPVEEFGFAEAQDAAARGVFVGTGQLKTTTVQVVKSVTLS